MTVAFVTLLLGLVSGPREIVVAPGAGVASVEIVLDGRVVANLTRAPWRTVVDLGEAAEPHDLVAIAKDAEGRETGRTRQRVNLPRASAEATVLVEGSGGRGRVARVSWRAVSGEKPTKARATFNGAPLVVEDPARIPIPDFLPERLQLLHLELDFPENLSAVVDVAFGGRKTDETGTELTAIPVLLGPKTKKLPSPDAMQGWFLAAGVPVVPAAIDAGPAEVVFVVDRDVRVEFGRTRAEAARLFSRADNRRTLALKDGQLLSLVFPVALRREHSGATWDLFPRSETFTPENGGVAYLLGAIPAILPGPGEQRLSDAIGVAALAASERNRARAVVVVTGPSPEDASRTPAAAQRRYLEAIRVPLVVWNPIGPEATPFGPAVDVSNSSRFTVAVGQLRELLSRQRIVWFEGTLLPQTVALGPEARGLEIAR